MKAPQPVPTRPWQNRARCRQNDVDPSWFFGHSTLHALETCRRCPVSAPCLSFALAVDAVGVWGGTTDADRHRINRKAG